MREGSENAVSTRERPWTPATSARAARDRGVGLDGDPHELLDGDRGRGRRRDGRLGAHPRDARRQAWRRAANTRASGTQEQSHETPVPAIRGACDYFTSCVKVSLTVLAPSTNFVLIVYVPFALRFTSAP